MRYIDYTSETFITSTSYFSKNCQNCILFYFLNFYSRVSVYSHLSVYQEMISVFHFEVTERIILFAEDQAKATAITASINSPGTRTKHPHSQRRWSGNKTQAKRSPNSWLLQECRWYRVRSKVSPSSWKILWRVIPWRQKYWHSILFEESHRENSPMATKGFLTDDQLFSFRWD